MLPKSKKWIILDIPDDAHDKREKSYNEKRKRNNGADSVVKTLNNDIKNILNTYDDLAHPFDDKVCDDEVAEVRDDTHVVSFSNNVDVSIDTQVVDFSHMQKSWILEIIFKLGSLMFAIMFNLM